MTILRSRITGVGAYLPQRVVTNDDLAKVIDTSDEWITERSGIRQRHVAAEGELTSDLATKAAQEAMDNAGLTADDIDMVIVGTTTPDDTFPSTACKVQANLGMTRGVAFDLQAVCSGFLFGLATADKFIRAGEAKNIIVIGAETMSRILDWEDRDTCVLFGDGAGAVVVQATEGKGDASDTGVLSTHLHTDGRHREMLKSTGGPSSTGTVGKVHMSGKEVFKHAVVNLSAVVKEALDAHDLTGPDLDWLVPHQANMRILVGTAKKARIPQERIIITVDKHANTSAASIPLALHEGVKSGKIKPGQLVLLEAMGAGFTWGSALVRM